ncbi:hypothetical protein AMS68_000876 [Peltaster fructicola]|uniref:RBR-type E3 ubiquitin transferase n=1 Tax=Peltaster fructicola TaxID=286661 RepID=A0A6H0XL53_9PEZI|nr:hypothetical protein AMS68_000876 [Peltaster fructicola]
MADILAPFNSDRPGSLLMPAVYDNHNIDVIPPMSVDSSARWYLELTERTDGQTMPDIHSPQPLSRKQAVRRSQSPRFGRSINIAQDVNSDTSSMPALSSSSSASSSRHSSATSSDSDADRYVLLTKESTSDVYMSCSETSNHEVMLPSLSHGTNGCQDEPRCVLDRQMMSTPPHVDHSSRTNEAIPDVAESLCEAPPEGTLEFSTDSDNSSAITAIEVFTNLHARGNSTDAENSTDNHVNDGVSSNTNESRLKGKETLSSIRNISWELIEEQDVRSFCLAYDTPSGAPTADMGAVLSIQSRWRDNKTSSTHNAQSTCIDSALSTSPEQEVVPPQNTLARRLRLLTRESERVLIRKRNQQIERLAAQVAHNEQRMQESLARLHAEELAFQQRAEHLRLEARRQEESDRETALALQKSLDEEDAEACRLAEQQARLMECTVCGDQKDKDDFPGKAPTTRCQHASRVCADCLDSWIASALNDHGIDGIKCPECPEKLAYADVQAVATAATFATYDKATTMQALSSLPEFAWCLAPNCKSGQLNIDNSNFMDCVSCGYKQCLRHKVAWHSGETCEKYEYRTSGAKAKEEEEKTLAMLDSMSKICPGPNCGWRIQKTDGCDHITCRKCQFQFCWQCLASHVEIKKVGNTAHKKDCKFHSNNLDLAWPFNRH